MKLIFGILSLWLVSVSCSGLPSIGQISPRSDFTLAKFVLQKQAQVQAADPAISTQCFGLYLPLLQDVANQWSTDYSYCVGNATEDRTDVMTEMKHQQDVLNTTATGVCSYVNKCQEIMDSMDFFNCFAILSENVLNTIYTISNNASDDAASMLQQLEVIDINLYKCTNISERTYVQQTAQVYDALDACLLNGLPAPAPEPETTKAPEATETTVAPAETTTTEPGAPTDDPFENPQVEPVESSADLMAKSKASKRIRL